MEQTTVSFEKKNKKTKLIYIGLCSILVLVGLSSCLFVLLYVAQQKLVALGEIRYQSNLLADQLRQSSDDLTRLVRSYVVTGNKKYEQQFWDVLAIRDGKKPRPLHYDRIYWDFLSVKGGKPPYPLGEAVPLVELMKKAGFTEREFSLLAEAQKNSDQLVELERVAMNGITTGETEGIPNDTSGQQVAIKILFGEKYHLDKVEIMRHINMFLEELENRTYTEVTHQAARLQLFLISEISTFSLIICAIVFVMRISKRYHTGMVSVLDSTVKDRTVKLLKANEKLKELDRLKSMFIASMSHELRTPLNSIIGFTGMTLMGLSGELNEEQKDNIERAHRSSEHLLALISDIIDISKIEAGVIEIYCEPFFLHEITDEAISNTQHLFKNKNISLQVNVPEGIGLNTDRKRLLQCLVNLLSNAAKYTTAGKIVVSSKTVGENIELSVTDTGIGISEKDLSKLFTAFERIKTRLTVKEGGTGLGLYLTKKITTELLKGVIEMESKEGVGSTFRIRVPLVLNAKINEKGETK